MLNLVIFSVKDLIYFRKLEGDNLSFLRNDVAGRRSVLYYPFVFLTRHLLCLLCHKVYILSLYFPFTKVNSFPKTYFAEALLFLLEIISQFIYESIDFNLRRLRNQVIVLLKLVLVVQEKVH